MLTLCFICFICICVNCATPCVHHVCTQVAAHSLRAGVRGAACNVDINLAELSDEDYKEKVQ